MGRKIKGKSEKKKYKLKCIPAAVQLNEKLRWSCRECREERKKNTKIERNESKQVKLYIEDDVHYRFRFNIVTLQNAY